MHLGENVYPDNAQDAKFDMYRLFLSEIRGVLYVSQVCLL